MYKSKSIQLVVGLLSVASLLSGCIKDDFIDDEVEAIVRITSNIDTLAMDSSFQFEVVYLNNVGIEEMVDIAWSSSNEQKLVIKDNGLATATALGDVTVFASYSSNTGILKDSIDLTVGENTSVGGPSLRSGVITTTSSYELRGDFEMSQEGEDVIIEVKDNYRASTSLPGLYLYLTNNPRTTAGALEVGPVKVFSGEHTYNVKNIDISDFDYLLYFCKPFNVKVGDGKIN